MKTNYKILLVCSIFWTLTGALLLDIQSRKNEKTIKNLDEKIEELNHSIAVLKDSITIMEMDMMSNKIDLGRYESAIDQLGPNCKPEMDEILSHME